MVAQAVALKRDQVFGKTQSAPHNPFVYIMRFNFSVQINTTLICADAV